MLLTSDRQRGAIPLGVCEFGKTRCGVSTAGLSSLFGRTSRAEAEHELAQPRPVFVPLPACRFRDVTGYHLRMHPKAETGPVEEGQAARRTPARSSVAIGPEQAEKPLPTQAHTRRSSAARTAFTHAPLERRSCHCGNGDGRGASVSRPRRAKSLRRAHLAATNKCLARSNKSRTRAAATRNGGAAPFRRRAARWKSFPT